MKKLIAAIIVTITLCSTVCSSAFAHSGRTDSNGGHYVRTSGYGRTVGTYHYH